MTFKELEMGTKLELQIYDENGDIIRPTFISQLEWVEDDGTVVIAAPIHEGVVYPVRVGSKMNIFFVNKTDLYKVKANVLNRAIRDNLAVLRIKCLSEFEKIQRRQFFRFQYATPVRYRVVTSMNEELNKGIKYIKTITGDISGGGLSILLEEKISKDQLLQCEMTLDNDKTVSFYARVMKVIMRENDEKYKYEAGISYKKIEYKDREAIIAFIFSAQRKLIKKGLI